MSEIKTVPTQGYRYKVVRGDRLNNIEKTAYGSVKGLIEGANPFLGRRKVSLEGRPTIYPGDILTVPVLPTFKTLRTNQEKVQLKNKSKNDLTIIIGKKEITYESARIIKTLDTAADGWTAKIPWTPGLDHDLDALLTPYTYPDAKVFIGDELLISGLLYTVTPSISNTGRAIELAGFSYTADCIDSTVPPPYEENNVTLQQRADKLLQHIGIKSVFDFDPGGLFDRVTAERTDTIFSHLASLASQRGLLVSSTPEGNLLFTKANPTAPVATLATADGQISSLSASFNGRAAFNNITAFGESPGNPAKSASAIDELIPKSRFIAFSADDTTDGDIQQAAEWRRSQIYSASFEIQIPVIGWYANDRELWRAGQSVEVVAPEIFAPNGFTFLIKQVEYVIENTGRTGVLSVVPPTVYTGEQVVFPWS